MDEKKFMSRKFGMACFVLLSVIPLLLLGYVAPGDYVNLTGATLGLYFTGSVAADYVAKK